MASSRKDNKGRVLRKGEQYRADGRYAYVYLDPFGRKKHIYSKDLAKLRKKEEELIKNQLDGLDVYVAGNATLNFLFDRYISTKTELRKTTYSNYVYMYDHYVRDGFGKKKLADIKYSDVLYFYFSLINENGLTVSTVDVIQTILHPTFELAVRDNIIRTNPTNRVMAEIKKKPGKNKGVRHALTMEQQRAFLNYIKDHPMFYRWNPLFVFLLGTGCRIGEAVGLRWDDLDYKKRLININHSVVYYPDRTGKTTQTIRMLSLPKTEAGVRVIPMMDAVYEALQEEYRYQQEEGFNITEIDGMSGFVFTNRFGNVHNPEGIRRTIRRIVDAYNTEEVVLAKKEKRQPIILPYFSCHHLRHTFCTRFCEVETNIKVIQEVMGHANIETTMDIYAEATNEKKTEAIQNLAMKLDVF